MWARCTGGEAACFFVSEGAADVAAGGLMAASRQRRLICALNLPPPVAAGFARYTRRLLARPLSPGAGPSVGRRDATRPAPCGHVGSSHCRTLTGTRRVAGCARWRVLPWTIARTTAVGSSVSVAGWLHDSAFVGVDDDLAAIT